MSVMDLLKAQQISDDESFQYLTTTDSLKKKYQGKDTLLNINYAKLCGFLMDF